jgi:hypothetical protein
MTIWAACRYLPAARRTQATGIASGVGDLLHSSQYGRMKRDAAYVDFHRIQYLKEVRAEPGRHGL